MSRPGPVRLGVLRTEDLTAHLRRVVLGEHPASPGELDAFIERCGDETDLYVKLVYLAQGFTYPDPLDLDAVRETMPAEAWPILRTYTIRHVDREAREVWIDFVLHGDEGVAGPWAAQTGPGDSIWLRGPGGAYAPDPAADHHLLVGDDAALPAIAASVETLPSDARATVFVEVDDVDSQVPLVSKADVDVHWLHRDGAAPGTTTLLDDAVRSWVVPEGRLQVFVHGEAGLLKTVRPYLVRDLGVDRADVSISAYWRLGDTEESFRTWKSQQSEPILRPS